MTALERCNSNNTKVWTNFSSLKFEEERLKTFEYWPIDYISPKHLANDGFFYTRENDKVQCVFCHGVIGSWELNDNPHMEHAKYFPNCMLIKGLEVGNVPLENLHKKYGITLKEIDVCGLGKTASNPSTQQTFDEENLEFLGINPHSSAAHLEYTTFESRLSSFSNWPLAATHDAVTLAKSGFYFTGVSDHVKCFFCDGGLRNWDINDDPWEEHVKWFPDCQFLKHQAESQQYFQKLKLDIKNSNHEAGVVGSAISSEMGVKPATNTFQTSEKDPSDQSSTRSGDRVTRVEDQGRRLNDCNDRLLCKICMQNDVGVVFLPCGHLASCQSCAYALVTCPVCRETIKGTVKTFIS